MVFPRMRHPGHFTTPRESAVNGPRVTTRVLRLRTRRTATNKEQVYQASGYEQGIGTGNPVRTRETLRRPPKAVCRSAARYGYWLAHFERSNRSAQRQDPNCSRRVGPTRAAGA